ncbi:MAG: prephenate dehydrogenase [Candidatus Baltobacteraceae bacterium]
MIAVTGIVGTGLIGASIGLRARANGEIVLGADRSGEALRIAREREAIDEAVSIGDLLARADRIVVAVPVSQCITVLAGLSGRSLRAELVLDVASVKTPVVLAAADISSFVGTHPMAGSERSGPAAARADLFAGQTWAYVPVKSASLKARAVAFIESMGAIAVEVDAQAHDQAVALSSHLPQLFATLFSQRLASRHGAIAQLRGPVARELLRLGHSDYSLWKDVFEANAENIVPELEALARALEVAARELQTREFRTIEEAFKAQS